jgi:hypothetical protein
MVDFVVRGINMQGNNGVNKNHRLHISGGYNSMPLVSQRYPFVCDYLAALNGVIARALEQYSKVFAFRCDLRIPEWIDAKPDDFKNEVMSRFIESLKAKIKHNRQVISKEGGYAHDSKVRYFWVREVGDRGRVHFHVVILLNGHAFNWLGTYGSPSDNMANRVCEAWSSALRLPIEEGRPSVHFPESPSYMLYRGDSQSVDAFFQRASYLCKVTTKQHGFGHHGYGNSRG